MPLHPLFRPAAALVALLLAAGSAAAQREGAVRGHAVEAGTGRPLSAALVVLAPEEGDGEARTALTDAAGSFRFGGVAPGVYRLRVERIGFRADASSPFRVEPGRTVERRLEPTFVPLTLEGLTAVARCYRADELEGDAELAALWNEARKAMEIRRAFERTYGVAYRMRQETTLRVGRGRRAREVRDTLSRVIGSTPSTVAVEEAARRARWRERGFVDRSGRRVDFELPDGRELLDPQFLRIHCLDSRLAEEDGAWELSFRPLPERRRRYALRGRIRLDAATFQVRELVFEHLDRDRPILRTTVVYGDVGVPGGTIRLPVRGDFRGDARGLVRGLREVEGTLGFDDYRVWLPGEETEEEGSAP